MQTRESPINVIHLRRDHDHRYQENPRAFRSRPLLLSGCVSTESSGSGGGSVNLIKSDTLSVCTNTPYKPFEYEENGKVVGLDADIAEAIAKDLGVKAQLTSISFEGLDSGTGLTSGQCDIALAGISVTDARKSKMAFSNVYFEDKQAILIPKDSKISSAADLKGAKVGAQQATSGEEYAKNQGADVTQYEDTSLMISALETGKVQAVSANLSVISEALKANPSLKIAYETSEGADEIAAAVSPTNTTLLEKANQSIDKLKNSGELNKLKEKWVGTSSTSSTAATAPKS